MSSIHGKSNFVRFASAVVNSIVPQSHQNGGFPSFLRRWLKFPITHEAVAAMESIPKASFSELFPENLPPQITFPSAILDRHSWNVRLDEEIYIGLIVQAIGARRIFEIGTFDGGTTRALALSAGADAKVFTLDLAEEEFDLTQGPPEFQGCQVGAKFRGTELEARITQLFGNSMTFDFGSYERSMDVVFVDAAHDYPHGLADSRTALKLARPGGIILWHDFDPGWPGLAHAIIEATQKLPLKRVGNTTLGILRVP